MNDAAQSPSRMVGAIKSPLLSPRPATPLPAQNTGGDVSVVQEPQQHPPQSQAQAQAQAPQPMQQQAQPLVSQQPAQQTAPQEPDKPRFSDAQKLAVFENVLTHVESRATLNPPHSVNVGGKEASELSSSPDQSSVDAGASIQYVEHEKNPEIPVEVEGYLKKVNDMAEQKQPEVYIADGSQEQAGTAYPSRPVVVLPITQEVEEAGAKKNPSFSVRWLVEWSRKIIKIFAGKVIYKENPASSPNS